ncbi:MFS transporter [Tabrizicola oligotrophica]|uniref:MFS transporter n=1 Tax=Tabrizicola oligotrophica TaxID=2710650 RepID=A0A6M0QUH2_9RHOB|nr:MFS transporter [Tabrizicola oligotrophica]NEY91057.1 MFS transporter [Tabrizicola oligotrophica]
MALRYIPLHLKHPATPKITDFAILSGLEAAVRGTLISTVPIAVYDAFGSASNLSTVYLVAGVITLFWGLMVPRLTQIFPRRWVYSAGCGLYLVAMALFILGTALSVQLAILISAMATVTTFVCLNAYVLDYVARADLGRTQGQQMVYAAVPWAVGPLTGVWLRGLWAPLPFLVAGGFAALLLAVFWYLRLGNGKQIARARGPAVNPLAYLGRFFQQPRLIIGWLFAVFRSCGWWVYVVYVPVFCIESGLGDKLGGVMLSVSNATLLISPLLAGMARRLTVRRTMLWTLAYCTLLFTGATVFSAFPHVALALLFLSSFGLVMLDVTGGLPFLMSVKPSERAEMAAVYSSFRDVSGILTPGAAWLVLLVFPLSGIFAASGVAFGLSWWLAQNLHPRLGTPRPSRGGA